jgi:Flp pilus assembly protein TadG
MFTRRGSRRRGTEGQVLVLVAGGFIAFIAIVGLVIDGGIAFLNRRDGQNASDLASIAGAQKVTEHYLDGGRTTDNVYDAIAASIASNGCASVGGTPCTFTATYVAAGPTRTTTVSDGSTAAVPSGTIGVAVDVTRLPKTFFSGMLGFASWKVDTEAIAISTRPSSIPTGVMLPIAACGWEDPSTPNDCVQASSTPAPGNAISFTAGQIYDLTDGMDAPGGFGWLSWNGSNSASEMADRICNPNNPAFSLDDPYDSPGTPGGVMGTNPATGETWFPIDPGKSNASAVRACLDGWIDSGATVLIPIYDIVTGNGNNAWYHITGVAAFVLTAREQPAVDQIQGRFVEYFPLSDVPGAAQLPPGPGDTTVNLRLVK